MNILSILVFSKMSFRTMTLSTNALSIMAFSEMILSTMTLSKKKNLRFYFRTVKNVSPTLTCGIMANVILPKVKAPPKQLWQARVY